MSQSESRLEKLCNLIGWNGSHLCNQMLGGLRTQCNNMYCKQQRARQVGGEGIGLGGWEERARQVGGEGIGLGRWEERALD